MKASKITVSCGGRAVYTIAVGPGAGATFSVVNVNGTALIYVPNCPQPVAAFKGTPVVVTIEPEGS